MNILKDLRDWVLSWQLSVVALFASCLFLWLPSSAAAAIGIALARSAWQPWPALVAICAFSATVVHSGMLIQRDVARRNAKRRVLACLDTLSDRERILLTYCLFTHSISINLPVALGEAKALVQKGLLEAAGGTGHAFSWAHTIPDFVWNAAGKQPKFCLSEEEAAAFKASHAFQVIRKGQVQWRAWDDF